MYEAARKDDQIKHSGASWGTAIGAIAGVAALIPGPGTVAALVLGAVALAAPILGGFVKYNAGPIKTGAKKVLIGGKPAARAVVDTVGCDAPKVIAQGSMTVAIEDYPAARIDDETQCGGSIGEGFPKVFIGLEPATYVEIESEVPLWLEVLGFASGFAGLGKGLLKLLAKGGLKGVATGGIKSFLKGAAGKIKDGVSKLKNSFKCVLGHPVDVATGDVVDGAEDFSLPGVIPLVWTRDYCSSRAHEETSLGAGGWTHSFDQWVAEDGELWTLRDEGGRDIYFEKVGAGQSTFHRRERLTLTAQPDGVFSVYSDETRLTRLFAPLASGGRSVLRAIRDPFGNEIAFYHEEERLIRIVDTAGRVVHLQNDAWGRVVRVEVWAREELQRWVDYTYHATGELSAAINALGHADRFEYDDSHRMTKTTLKNGVSFYYAYDPENGRCIRTWGDGGLHTVELLYDLDLGTTEVRGNGEPRVYYWDDSGLVRREETPDGRSLRVVDVDDDGYVLAEGVTEAELTRYEYDERGHRTKVIDAAGNVTTWEYAGGHPARRLTPDDLVTAYVHDERGTLQEVVYPSGVRYRLDHDLHGRLMSIRDGDRAIASFGYDGEHNVVCEVDARGAATDYVYDASGRPTARRDALGRVTQVDYDRLGQPVAIHAPDGSVTRAEYEPLGNIARTVDALGNISELEYSGTGVLSRLVQPDGTVWSMQYDRGERLTEILNPAGEVYAFAYDDAGRVVSERTFDGRTLRYDYGETGRLECVEHPGNDRRSYRYDPLGNILVDRTLGSLATFERDKLGRLTRAVLEERGGKVVTELRRDGLGRVVEEIQNGRSVGYAYDDHGRRIERTLPDGSTTRYGYELGGELAHVEHGGRRVVLDRDALGREVSRRADRGGFEIRSAYDVMDRLVERQVAGGAAHAALSRRTWKYDALGRVRQIDDGRWGTTVYQYDRIDQLVEAKRGGYREVFQYDITGSLRNVLRDLADAGHARAWETRPGNLLTRTETAQYEYDACGRRTRKTSLVDTEVERAGAVTEYVWDERDRLREVKKADGERVLFTYDAFGRRVRKEVLPGVEQAARRVVEFLWDGDELAADLDSRRGSRVFVHEPGTFVPMLQVEQGEVFAVVNDHLGMPKELIDEDGRVAWSAAHSAWGRVLETSGDASRKGRPVESPFRLLGQYADEETGLCYTRFRYFDAETGRWCSPDPLGITGGSNLHQFDGAPTQDVDPLGLACWTKTGRIKKERLPRSGKIRFVPPKNWNPNNPARGPQNGFLDKFGNEWVKGPSRTPGEPFEWDVQLSKMGQSQVGRASRDKKHLNISLGGKVTH